MVKVEELNSIGFGGYFNPCAAKAAASAAKYNATRPTPTQSK